MERRVWVFFYGSFINRAVLKDLGYTPPRCEVARLDGFDIQIAPLANLVESDQHAVYGIVAPATHRELQMLYRYAEHSLGGVYLPEPVLVMVADGLWRPALCYIAADLTIGAATNDYIDRIVQPAREYGFPDWYLTRLESFRP